MYKTYSRNALSEFFKENKHNSYTSLDLIEIFKDSINKATIYRNLKYLEDNGFIHKTYDDKKQVYEYMYADDCDRHFHLKCIKCGKIIHLHCDDADEFISHIKNEHNFSISENITTIYGVCEECEKC